MAHQKHRICEAKKCPTSLKKHLTYFHFCTPKYLRSLIYFQPFFQCKNEFCKVSGLKKGSPGLTRIKRLKKGSPKTLELTYLLSHFFSAKMSYVNVWGRERKSYRSKGHSRAYWANFYDLNCSSGLKGAH